MKKAVLALILVLVMVSSALSGVQVYVSASETSADSSDTEILALPEVQTTPVQLIPSPPKIHLKAGVFDPVNEPEPALSGLRMGILDGGPYLLQLTGPTQEPWLHELEALGVTVLNYIPEYTYIVLMDAAAIKSVSTLSYVRWYGVYHPSYKIIPLLSGRTGSVDVNIDIFQMELLFI